MPGFRASMEAFYHAAMAMSRRVLRLLALSLDLPPAWFLDRFQRPLTTLRLLHYSAQPSDPAEVRWGRREGQCLMSTLNQRPNNVWKKITLYE